MRIVLAFTKQAYSKRICFRKLVSVLHRHEHSLRLRGPDHHTYSTLLSHYARVQRIPLCSAVTMSRSVCPSSREYGLQNGDKHTKQLYNKDYESHQAEDIYQRVFYADDNLIAVNKPRGLSVYGSYPKISDGDAVQDKDEKQTVFSLVQSLPYLGEKLKSPDVDVGLSLKSYYSGLVLLCKTWESKTKLGKCLSQAVTQKQQFMTYLVVTVGVPQCPHGVDLIADIKREYLHDKEMSVVCDETSHSARKSGMMMRVHFAVKPILINTDIGVALVEVTINKDKWEAVEVLMSHYLSPVLGDHIYSSRTFRVSDVPFPASPHAAVPGTQRLLPSIIRALRSQSYLSKEMPLLSHRYKVTLHRFPVSSSSPLSLTAAPQSDFIDVLRCLRLYKDEMFRSSRSANVIQEL